MNTWEIHPMLVHFPIAFLLAGVLLDLLAMRRQSELLTRSAAGLLLVGVVSGWLAAAAGMLAYYTVPAHTEAAHVTMYWHLGIAVTMLLLFTLLAVTRWFAIASPAKLWQATLAVTACVLLVITGALGGQLVYHGGAGVSPELLSREIREGHTHSPNHVADTGDDRGHSHSNHKH